MKRNIWRAFLVIFALNWAFWFPIGVLNACTTGVGKYAVSTSGVVMVLLLLYIDRQIRKKGWPQFKKELWGERK